MKEGGSISQLKITLEDVSPPIWRRIQVASTTRFGKVHETMQRAMGWANSLPHAFGREMYGPPDPEGETTDVDNRKIRLEDVAAAKSRFSLAGEAR